MSTVKGRFSAVVYIPRTLFHIHLSIPCTRASSEVTCRVSNLDMSANRASRHARELRGGEGDVATRQILPNQMCQDSGCISSPSPPSDAFGISPCCLQCVVCIRQFVKSNSERQSNMSEDALWRSVQSIPFMIRPKTTPERRSVLYIHTKSTRGLAGEWVGNPRDLNLSCCLQSRPSRSLAQNAHFANHCTHKEDTPAARRSIWKKRMGYDAPQSTTTQKQKVSAAEERHVHPPIDRLPQSPRPISVCRDVCNVDAELPSH